MNAFIRFDAWLITSVFEPIAWRIEYRFGRNNFWLARQLVIATCAVTIARSPGSYVILGVVLLCMPVLWLIIFASEYHMRRMPARMNRWKGEWFSRFMILSLVIVFVKFPVGWTFGCILEAAYTLLMPAILYFLACNPMPPGWSPPQRVRAAAMHAA